MKVDEVIVQLLQIVVIKDAEVDEEDSEDDEKQGS